MTRLYLTLILVLIALGLAGFVFWRYFYLATIRLDTIPTEARISVNGQPQVEKNLQLPRGSYTIQVSAPGYRSQSFEVQVGLGSQVNKRVELVALPRPVKLLDGPIQHLTPTPDRQTFFFEQSQTLHLYRPGEANSPAIPITPPLPNIETIDWSPDFSLAVLKKTNGETGIYDFNRYDLLHQEYRPLNQPLAATAWDAQGNVLYGIQTDAAGQRTIVRLNRAGAGQTNLYDLHQLPAIEWQLVSGPANNLVLSSPSAKVAAPLVLFDTFQRLAIPLTESDRVSDPVLSPDKTHIAYLDNGELVISEISGKNKRNTALRPAAGAYSFADPSTLVVLTANQVAIITVTDGTQEKVEVFAPDPQIRQAIASPDKKTLYYTYQGNLYRLPYK